MARTTIRLRGNTALALRPITDRLRRAAPIVLYVSPFALVAGLFLLLAQPSTPPFVIIQPSTVPQLPTADPDPRPRLALPASAYAEPEGERLGDLERGRRYTPRARYGAAWVQLDAEGAGLVWVREGELPGVAVSALADLAPPPQPQVVYVVAQPAPAPAAGETAAYGLPDPTPAPAAAPAVAAPPPPAAPAAEEAPPEYLVPPQPTAARPVMAVAIPTAPPCSIREVGRVLRPCNGITP